MKNILKVLNLILTLIAKLSTNKPINAGVKILNYTPHVVNLLDLNGNVVKAFPSCGVVRCSTSQKKVGCVNGITLNKVVFGKVDGLPKQQKNTLLIVSNLVLQASKRKDLIAPCDQVRNDKGQIIGCKSFSR